MRMGFIKLFPGRVKGGLRGFSVIEAGEINDGKCSNRSLDRGWISLAGNAAGAKANRHKSLTCGGLKFEDEAICATLRQRC